MNLCTRVIPQSQLEINKIEINDRTLHLPIPSLTGNLRPSDKIMKIKVIILLETAIVIDIIKITTLPITTDIERTTDIEATVEIICKTLIDLVLDKDITVDLQVHSHLDPDMTTIIKEELHPDLHIDHHTETTPIIDLIHDQDIDLVLNHKETPLDDTITHIDLHLDQEITDQDLEHPQKQTTKRNKSSRC